MENKIRSTDIIIRATQNIPEFIEAYNLAASKSSEIVVLGSYAVGCERIDSDIDILFVGNGKRNKTRKLDFIWIKPDKVNQKSWLGSELANHVASYGLWLKGDGAWRRKVFVSETSISRKKEAIYVRLIHLYLKRSKYRPYSMKKLSIKVLLDFYRLYLLTDKKAIPPTKMINDLIINQDMNLITLMLNDNYLGPVGATLLKEIFPNNDFDNLFLELKTLLGNL